jgi:hypothetical protein
MNSSLKWACTSLGTCVGSFLAYAVPVLQVVALCISIYAGIQALRYKK